MMRRSAVFVVRTTTTGLKRNRVNVDVPRRTPYCRWCYGSSRYSAVTTTTSIQRHSLSGLLSIFSTRSYNNIGGERYLSRVVPSSSLSRFPKLLRSSILLPLVPQQQQQQRYRHVNKKNHLRKQAKRDLEAAIRLRIDTPYVLDDYIYITTIKDANEWAKHTMEEILHKLINKQTPIHVGIHVEWCDTNAIHNHSNNRNNPNDDDDNDTVSKKEILKKRRQIAILQLSIRLVPIAVFHVTAMMDNYHHINNNNSVSDTNGANEEEEDDHHTNNSGTDDENENEEGDDDDGVYMTNDFHFPIQLKKLLELSNVVICAIRANEVVDELYQSYNIDCCTRVDVVDISNKALKYQGGTGTSPGCLVYEPTPTSQIRIWNIPTLLPSQILDHLCDYFWIAPTMTTNSGDDDDDDDDDNDDEVIPIKRPDESETRNYMSFPPKQLMTDGIVKYYATQAYHARLLVKLFIDMVRDGEDEYIHPDNDEIAFMLNPNYEFHPTFDPRPTPIRVQRRVAILMTDDEYESFIVEGGYAGKHDNDPRRYEIDESKMTRSYSHKLLAIGSIEFLGEPYGILRRFYNTSYLVGTDKYEDEAIVKLQRVKQPKFPILPLGCGDEMYWKYKFYSHNAIENQPSNQWPDQPTLGWVFQHALRPYIIVDQTRLVIFNQEEVPDPYHKPWRGVKKNTDYLPDLPNDILDHL